MSKTVAEMLVNLKIDAKGVDKTLAQTSRSTKQMETAFKDATKALNTGEKSVDKYNNAIKAGKNVTEQYKQKMTQLTTAYDKNSEKLQRLVEKQKSLPKEIEQAKVKLTQLGTTLGKTSDEYKEQEQVVRKLEEKYKGMDNIISNTVSTMRNQENQLNQTQTALDRTTSEVAELETQLGRLNGTNLQRLSTSLTNLGSTMQSVGGKMTSMANSMKPLAYALTAAGGAMVGLATQTEFNLTKVDTLLNGTGQSANDFKDKIMDMANKGGYAVTDYTSSLYDAVSANGNLQGSIVLVDQAMTLAKGGFTDVNSAVDILTTVTNAYGMELSETSKVSDTLIQIQNKGKTTVDALSKSMGAVIPTAAANSVSVQELGTSYAILTANGIKTEQAGTIIKSMLAELGKSGTIADKALKKLTGEGFKGLIDGGKTVADVLKILEKEAKKNGKSLSDMFGSVEAGTGALSLLSKGSEHYDSVLKEMSKTGAAQTAADQIAATAKDKLASAIAKLKNAFVELGEKMMPVFTGMVDGLTNAIDKFSGFSDGTQTAILAVGGFIAIGVPLLGFLGMAISGLGTLATLGGTLAGALGLATSATVATGAAVTGTAVATTGLAVSMSSILIPLGLVAAAFGLVLGSCKLYNNYLENNAVMGADYYISKLGEVGKQADKLGQDISTLEAEHANTMIAINLGGDLGDRLPKLTDDLKAFYAEEARLKEEKIQNDINFTKEMIETTEGATRKEFEVKLEGLNKQLTATKNANAEELKNSEQHFKDIMAGKTQFNETDKAAFQSMHEEKINALIENNEAVKQAVANGDKNIDEIRQATRDNEVAKTIAHLATTRTTELEALQQSHADKVAQIQSDKTLSDTARAEALEKINANYLEDKTLMQTNFAEQLALTEKLGSDELAMYDLRTGKLLTAQQQKDTTLLEMTKLNNDALLTGTDAHYKLIDGKIVSFTGKQVKDIDKANKDIESSWNARMTAEGLTSTQMESRYGTLSANQNKYSLEMAKSNDIVKKNYDTAFKASGLSIKDFEAKYGPLSSAIDNNKTLTVDANGKIVVANKKAEDSMKQFSKASDVLGTLGSNTTTSSSKIVDANGKSKTSFDDAKTATSNYAKEIDTVNAKTVNDKTATFTLKVAGKQQYNSAIEAMNAGRPMSLPIPVPTTMPIVDTVSPRFSRGTNTNKSDSISTFDSFMPQSININSKATPNTSSNTTNNFNLNFDKVEIINGDSYKEFAKKAVKYIDIELNKVENKNRKIKGGSIYA